ncbi:MAG: CehA/McbA family metallohydrolase [Myxococcota bacterium]
MRRVWLISLLVLLSCPKPPPDEPVPPTQLPLDEPLSAGQARCGLVTTERELIGGAGAYLEVGKSWRCYNGLVRFGGALREGAVGLALYGGALLDADVVRANEDEAGEDLLREMFPAPGFMGVDVQDVQVLKSGAEGGEAIIRVVGKSAPLGVLPQVALLQHPFQGDVITDFIMRPDVWYLEITTTVINNEPTAIDITLGDFLALGNGVRAFTPESGFDDSGFFSAASAYVGVGKNISYAYTLKEGRFTIPFVDAGGTGTLVKPDVLVTDQESYTRYLFVYPGGAADVLGQVYQLRGEPWGVLGVALKRGGQDVPGTITLYRAPLTPESKAVTQFSSSNSLLGGKAVPVGTYVIKAQADGSEVLIHDEEVTVGEREMKWATMEFNPNVTVEFHAHEVDANGADLGPIPAKLSVLPLNAPRPDGDMARTLGGGLTTYRVSPDGVLQADLPAGEYRFFVSRGPEYELFTHEASLQPGSSLVLDVPLRRVVETSGFIAAEFHQHTLGSLDADTDLPTKVLENAAEGVELAACTDHDNVKDYAPYVAQWSLTPFFQGWAGNEISYNGVGHFNAYPLDVDAKDPFKDVGARLWAGGTVAQLFASLRARAEDPVIHVSHPRASGGKGYFSQIRLDPTDGEVLGQTGAILGMVPEGTYSTFADDFDALEVNGEIADPTLLEPGNESELARLADEHPTQIPTMVDWFHLLSTGHHVAAMGNSDSHNFNDKSGWPRNYIVVGEDQPQAVTREEIRQAIRAQQLVVSNGLFVVPRVGGAVRLGRGMPAVVDAASGVTIELSVDAPSWLSGPMTLTVFRDGRPLHLRNESGVLVEDAAAPASVDVAPACSGALCHNVLSIQLRSTTDAWVVFVVRAQKEAGPVGQGSAYGYTNPVYLDVGGDGWE